LFKRSCDNVLYYLMSNGDLIIPHLDTKLLRKGTSVMEIEFAAIDEKHLVKELKKGAPGALKTLVSTHGKRLLKSSYFLCGSEADVDIF